MLQTLMGYTAETAGFVMSGGAICLILCFPIAGKLTNKYPAKYIMAFGWLFMTLGMVMSYTDADLQMSFGAASWVRIVQYVPISIIFVPLTVASYVGLSAAKNNEAAGLLAFMRNMGGSVGTSIVATVVARRSQFHQSILASHVTASNRMSQEALGQITGFLQHSGIDRVTAKHQAGALIYRTMQQQAALLSYVDVFRIMGFLFLVVIPLVFMMQRPHRHTQQH